MKRNLIIVLAFLLCLVLTVSMVFAGDATTASPGSTDDPLVSLSYVKQVLQPQIEASIINKLSDNTGTTEPTGTTDGDSKFEVVELKNGQILRPVGSIEIVLRSTSAVVISPSPTQGLSDLTAGSELLNNAEVPMNHLVLIPRADGRAVKSTSALAYIMVRGEYKIDG